MAIVVGIDGTGAAATPGRARDAAYDVAFADSFVRRIAGTGKADHRYFRGPVLLGGGLVDAVNGGYNFVRARRRMSPDKPICLTGYSRGAAGVVSLAAKLKRDGIDVQALMLFDCVDRHLVIDAETIPNNVAYVMHVIRSKYARSRESFSNDGMSYRPPTVYPAAYTFMCTHGGMGGVPWTSGDGNAPTDFIDEGGTDGMTAITYRQDEFVSKQVWAFVQRFLIEQGFKE